MATRKTNVEVEATETSFNTTKTTTVKAAKKFNPSDLIECKSVTYGELLLPGRKSGLLYSWANSGDITEVEYQDLQALKSMRSAYLFDPLFIINDKELLEQWKDLKSVYDKVVSADLDRIFALPTKQFKAKLQQLPATMKESIKNLAGSMIVNGELDSLAKIKAIDEVLGTELKLYIQ